MFTKMMLLLVESSFSSQKNNDTKFTIFFIEIFIENIFYFHVAPMYHSVIKISNKDYFYLSHMSTQL